VDALAGEILEAALADPELAYLGSPRFADTLWSWAQARAMATLAFRWCAGLDDPAEMFELKRGVLRAPAEVWRAMDAHATRLGARLGLDPASYAVISRDMGLAKKAVVESLDRMADSGSAIVARRSLAVLPAGVDEVPGLADGGDPVRGVIAGDLDDVVPVAGEQG
jgi:hypothetical protein